MPIDPSISLQVQTPNPTNMISGFLDLGLKRNALQRGNATLLSDIARSKAESDLAQTEAGVAAQTAPSRVSSAQSAAGTAAAQMNSAQLANLRDHTANMVQQLETLRTDPQISRKKVIQSVVDSATTVGAPTAAIAQALQGLPDTDDPQALQAFVTKGLVRAQQVSAHLNSVAPAPAFLNNGQQIQPVASGNPALTGVPAGAPQGVATQMQVPPTATTMQGGQPAYVGPRPGQQPGGAPIAAGPALGQAEAAVAPVQTNAAHYNGVVQEAGAAPTRIGVLQNIKGLARAAVTGDADAKRTLVSKFAGYVGWATGDEKQTATDVMAKEAALLASKGGNTDLSRLLNEAATPNGHMTEAAIRETADQLIGQEKLKQAAHKFFTGVPLNSPDYAAKLQQWNQVADPRVFEYASKTPDERAAMKARMSAADRAALASHMRALHNLGIDAQ